jgi:hypothetical protein
MDVSTCSILILALGTFSDTRIVDGIRLLEGDADGLFFSYSLFLMSDALSMVSNIDIGSYPSPNSCTKQSKSLDFPDKNIRKNAYYLTFTL